MGVVFVQLLPNMHLPVVADVDLSFFEREGREPRLAGRVGGQGLIGGPTREELPPWERSGV